MSRRGVLVLGLAVFWLVVSIGYAAAALRQKERLNLSATAGGQMPYLVYAQKIATEGLFGHFGDRNRMPLVPVLASFVYGGDWSPFVDRASWLAIGLSLVLLGGMGAIAYFELSTPAATAFLLIVGISMFAPQASFLQADVPFYALFFCCWWAMSRSFRKPTLWSALLVGALLALTYLTKASILLAIPIWLGISALRWLVTLRAGDSAASGRLTRFREPALGLLSLLVFLVIVSPYLRNNHEHFGRFFYNVNTTFFLWCDSWAQAQRFAEDHAIDQQFPDTPAEATPGPQHYWRTHSLGQIRSRLIYGLKTLGKLVLASPAFKYVVLLVGVAVAATLVRPATARDLLHAHRWQMGWTGALIAAYLLAYSWYVVVAYGDRFVLSLVAPLLFCLFAFVDKVMGQPAWHSRFTRFPMGPMVAVVILLFALADGVAAANSSWITPSPKFVRFYFDESHEELRRGNLEEARRGMQGVLILDPGFAAAHRDLGMIALAQGNPRDAVESLAKAVRLEPTWADAQNSLGSALIQAGRPSEAVSVLEKATQLQPDLAPGWYNLCGALLQLRERDRAAECLGKLEQLAPQLAQQLRAAFPEGKGRAP